MCRTPFAVLQWTICISERGQVLLLFKDMDIDGFGFLVSKESVMTRLAHLCRSVGFLASGWCHERSGSLLAPLTEHCWIGRGPNIVNDWIEQWVLESLANVCQKEGRLDVAMMHVEIAGVE